MPRLGKLGRLQRSNVLVQFLIDVPFDTPVRSTQLLSRSLVAVIERHV